MKMSLPIFIGSPINIGESYSISPATIYSSVRQRHRQIYVDYIRRWHGRTGEYTGQVKVKPGLPIFIGVRPKLINLTYIYRWKWTAASYSGRWGRSAHALGLTRPNKLGGVMWSLAWKAIKGGRSRRASVAAAPAKWTRTARLQAKHQFGPQTKLHQTVAGTPHQGRLP
jgi:hypothetical protein